ncbi:unnamed protein product [Camellia sinensis]|uniref:Transcription factor RAX2 n=1 Tax=Camellia lanceoleosa TaxID=1840588 RepID=A0ACC0GE19_9ERIC|nr:Transcription factor RAX2 [Camellia lanceoleosa]
MGRAPCCDKASVKRGPWSPEEDAKLKEYIEKNGTGGNWITLPQKAGLRRCGKSCRLRWLNYLRPNIKHGEFSDVEDRIICSLFASIGSRWSIIAAQLPGRTDNDIKNYWNTKLKKKLVGMLSSSHTSSLASKCSNNNNNAYYTSTNQTNSFIGYELPNISTPSSNLLSTTTACSSAQEGYVGPMHTVLMFGGGGDQASCSNSSDGSYNNQISHGREMEHDYYGEHMGFHLQSYAYNGVDHENQNLMISSSGGGDGNGFSVKPNGLLCGETPLIDYYSSLEEIKQLITTNNICSNNNNLNFFADENKTDEKVLYY